MSFEGSLVKANPTDGYVIEGKYSEIVHGMSESELESAYRQGGWTIRQIIHHLADSHLNSYCRYKLALTETSPVIKPYNEAAWAELIDGRTSPIDVSLTLLTALHTRWVSLLKSMNDEDFQRTFVHPEMGPRTLDATTGLYAWHGRHHMAHIRMARSRSAHA